MKKRFLAAALVLCMTAGLGACGGTEETKKFRCLLQRV